MYNHNKAQQSKNRVHISLGYTVSNQCCCNRRQLIWVALAWHEDYAVIWRRRMNICCEYSAYFWKGTDEFGLNHTRTGQSTWFAHEISSAWKWQTLECTNTVPSVQGYMGCQPFARDGYCKMGMRIPRRIIIQCRKSQVKSCQYIPHTILAYWLWYHTRWNHIILIIVRRVCVVPRQNQSHLIRSEFHASIYILYVIWRLFWKI